MRPSAAPTKQVRIIFAAAPTAIATTAAATQSTTPITIRVTTDEIEDFPLFDMREA